MFKIAVVEMAAPRSVTSAIWHQEGSMFRQRYLLAVLALEALGIGTAGCGQQAPATASPPIAKAPISQKTPPPAAKPIPNGEAQETPDKPASPAEKRYTWMEME